MLLARAVLSKAIKAAYAPSMYALACILSFALAYKLIGVDKHFVITDEQKSHPWFASFYISFMAQSNAMGDATPQTILGRTLFGAQVVFGWLYFLVVGLIIAAYTS